MITNKRKHIERNQNKLNPQFLFVNFITYTLILNFNSLGHHQWKDMISFSNF